MKACGIILRVLAILAALVMITTTSVSFAMQMDTLQESREELEEDIEEHEEDVENGYYSVDEDDCSTCENFNEREKSLDRSFIYNIINLIQSIVIYVFIYCGLLFALGSIVSKMGRSPALAAAQAPVCNVCPKCGHTRQPGIRFCGNCGTFFDN